MNSPATIFLMTSPRQELGRPAARPPGTCASNEVPRDRHGAGFSQPEAGPDRSRPRGRVDSAGGRSKHQQKAGRLPAPAAQGGRQMRFLMTISAGDPPDEQMMTEMGQFVEELSRAGVLLATGGLDPVGTRITSSGGKITMTDGPFTEAKEAIISFALIDVRSREEAIELARRFWQIVGNGEGAIRQVYGPESPAARLPARPHQF